MEVSPRDDFRSAERNRIGIIPVAGYRQFSSTFTNDDFRRGTLIPWQMNFFERKYESTIAFSEC